MSNNPLGVISRLCLLVHYPEGSPASHVESGRPQTARTETGRSLTNPLALPFPCLPRPKGDFYRSPEDPPYARTPTSEPKGRKNFCANNANNEARGIGKRRRLASLVAGPLQRYRPWPKALIDAPLIAPTASAPDHAHRLGLWTPHS